MSFEITLFLTQPVFFRILTTVKVFIELKVSSRCVEKVAAKLLTCRYASSISGLRSDGLVNIFLYGAALISNLSHKMYFVFSVGRLTWKMR